MNSKVKILSLGSTIALAIVFFLGSNASFAQTGNDPQYKQQTATSIDPSQKTITNNPEEMGNSQLPYYQYKGIQDLDQAKEAWFQDQPNQTKAVASSTTTSFLQMEKSEMTAALWEANPTQIKGFIREVLAAPMPDDYFLPVDVDDASSLEQAQAIVLSHFPEFTGLSGADFYEAIAHNPLRYIEMIAEYKALRAKYGSPYSAPQSK